MKRLDVPAGVPRHFAAPPAANTRRRDAGASRGKLRDERHAVLRVHGGRILRHKRAAAGAPSGGTRIDESRRVAIPTRANNTNTPNPPHASHPQGRNDVRDAKADVTDVRAPGKTQRVRRKNRAFDLEAENEVRVSRRRLSFFFVRFDATDARRECTARLTDFPDRRRRRVSENHRSSGEPRKRRRDGARPEAMGGAWGEAAKILDGGQNVVEWRRIV